MQLSPWWLHVRISDTCSIGSDHNVFKVHRCCPQTGGSPVTGRNIDSHAHDGGNAQLGVFSSWLSGLLVVKSIMMERNPVLILPLQADLLVDNRIAVAMDSCEADAARPSGFLTVKSRA